MNRRTEFGEGVLEFLIGYDYPGNVRELENLIEQGVALAPNGPIQIDDIIPPELLGNSAPRSARSLQEVVDRAEREAIDNVLREVEGNKERAAELLGLSSTTLWRKMKRLNVTYN